MRPRGSHLSSDKILIVKSVPRAYLSLGSNVGQRLTHLRAALRRLDHHENLRVVEVSPVYASQAHTRSHDDLLPDFLNLVAGIETELRPETLLDVCLAIEAADGRRRERGSWLPRTIDIDILTFADHVLDTNRLQLPHPRMGERRFVLLPLSDLDSGAWIPGPFESTVAELLSVCPDSLKIERRYTAGTVYSVSQREP